MAKRSATGAGVGALRAFVRGYAREQRRAVRTLADNSQAGCLVLAQLLNGTTSQRALCEELELDKALVSRTVKALVDDGLVSRTSAAEDARLSVLALTSAGRRSALTMHRELEALNERVLAQLSTSDRRLVEPAIRALTVALKATQRGEERSDDVISFETLARKDLRAVKALLRGEQLPTDDVDAKRIHLMGARANGELVGCIGLETAGSYGLVRSLVVAPSFRKRGLARTLYERLLVEARRRKLGGLFLLTTTAEQFFARLGFTRIARDLAPAEIRDTHEFGSLCPVTAAVMRRRMADVAIAFPQGALPLRPEVDGARYFAFSLDRTTLSYYELDAGARFSRHAHEGEQLTLVLEGHLTFAFPDRQVTLGPGEAVAIPPGVLHEVRAGAEPARAVDAWGPARLDLSA